jgi:hypothetical protein
MTPQTDLDDLWQQVALEWGVKDAPASIPVG